MAAEAHEIDRGLTQSKKCTATSRTGKTCKYWAIPGGTVCRFHGGSTPQVQRKAAERLAEASTRLTLYREGIPDLGNPYEALQRIAAEAVGFKGLLERRVAALEADQWRFTDEKGGEQLRSEVALYERAMDRAGKFAEVVAKLGIEDRLVRLEEAKVALVVAAFAACLAVAEIPEDVKAVMRTEFVKRLRTT